MSEEFRPYNLNLTDTEAFNFMCGFLSGLRIINQNEGYHETNTIVNDIDIGETHTYMGMKIGTVYVKQSDVESIVRVPVYTHTIQTEYGGFDFTIQGVDLNNTGAYIDSIEEAEFPNIQIDHFQNPEYWHVSGRAGSNIYKKPIILFYVNVRLLLYGEYAVGYTLGELFTLQTYLDTNIGTYRYITELYKYVDNVAEHGLVPARIQPNENYSIGQIILAGDKLPENNSATIGNKIRINTISKKSSLFIPSSNYIGANRVVILPLKALVSSSDMNANVNSINITMDFTNRHYYHDTLVEDTTFSNIIGANDWNITYRLIALERDEFRLEITCTRNEAVVADSVVGYIYLDCNAPHSESEYGEFQYHALLSGNNFIANNGNFGYFSFDPACKTYMPVEAQQNVYELYPHLTFDATIYTLQEQDITVQVGDYVSTPIHLNAGENHAVTEIPFISGDKQEVLGAVRVNSTYPVTVKRGSEYDIDAPKGVEGATIEPDLIEKIGLSDIFSIVVEQGAQVIEKDINENVNVIDIFNTEFIPGAQEHNRDINENVNIVDIFNTKFERGATEYSKENIDDITINDIYNTSVERGANSYDKNLNENININDTILTEYVEGRIPDDAVDISGDTCKVTTNININGIVDIEKE